LLEAHVVVVEGHIANEEPRLVNVEIGLRNLQQAVIGDTTR